MTQATLSRYINELRLMRTTEGYTLPNGDADPDPTLQFPAWLIRA